MSERHCESCGVRLSPLSSLWAHGICHSCYESDDYYDEGEIPEGMVICDRCNGEGEVDCRCGGDFCLCGAASELTCPVCHGEEWITKERWEKRAKAHREIMEALWGKPKSDPAPERTGSPSQAQTAFEQESNPQTERGTE